MKKKKWLSFLGVTISLAVILLSGSTALAAPPTPPHQFWGTVSFEGELAGDGITVTAEINGVEYESGVTDVDGQYGITPAFQVPSDDPDTPEKDGGVSGDIVVFKVNGVEAVKTVVRGPSTFKSGGASEINLNLPGAPPLTAEAGGPYSGKEDESISLSAWASGGTPPYTYAWDLDGDGSYETPGQEVSNSWSEVGVYDVGVQVTDDTEDTAIGNTVVTITPKELIAEAGGPYSGNTGQNISLSGAAEGGTPPYSYAWDLDGDGTYETSGKDVSHSWSAAGTYEVGFKVTDEEENTATDNAEVNVTTPSISPGTGGGTSLMDVYIFDQAGSFTISSTGELLRDIDMTSPDGNLNVSIPRGTVVLNSSGGPLTSMTAEINTSPHEPPEGSHIIDIAYDFKPSGATFEPAITFTWSYDPDSLPDDVAEDDLVLAYYDEEAEEWVELDCVVDTVNNTITANVEHFTTFAVIGVEIVEEEEPVIEEEEPVIEDGEEEPVIEEEKEPVVEEEKEPVVEEEKVPAGKEDKAPAAEKKAEPSKTNWPLIIGIIVVVVLALGVFVWRRYFVRGRY